MKLAKSSSPTDVQSVYAHVFSRLEVLSLAEFSEKILAAAEEGAVGYVVTPNLNHLRLLWCDEELRLSYAQACYVIWDSQFLSLLARHILRRDIKSIPGSDLTVELMTSLPRKTRVLVIGSSDESFDQLKATYPERLLTHVNVSSGHRDASESVDQIRSVLEGEAFDISFIALGAGRQESVARLLEKEKLPVGLCLCIGASIDFISGVQKRPPRVFSRYGAEWLIRALRSPRRLLPRYVRDGLWMLTHCRVLASSVMTSGLPKIGSAE